MIEFIFWSVVALAKGNDAIPITHTIVIDNTKFNPQVTEAKVGDLIIWKNQDLFPHTATAKGEFDSGNIQPTKTYKFRILKKVNVDYSCLFHPAMKGQLKISENPKP